MRWLLATTLFAGFVACASFGGDNATSADDAGVVSEGGGGDAGDDGPFCPHVDAAFCADFDGVQQPDIGFTAQDGDASVDLDDVAVSPPRSLRITTHPSSGPDAGIDYGRLRKKLSRVYAQDRITVDVDLRIDTFPKTGSFFSTLALELPDGRYVSVNFTEGSPSLTLVAKDSSVIASFPTSKPPVAEWFHLRLIADLNRGDFSLEYPGQSLNKPSTSFTAGTALDFTFDVSLYVAPATDAVVHYDNLVIATGP
jgi:hypothetical protein